MVFLQSMSWIPASHAIRKLTITNHDSAVFKAIEEFKYLRFGYLVKLMVRIRGLILLVWLNIFAFCRLFWHRWRG